MGYDNYPDFQILYSIDFPSIFLQKFGRGCDPLHNPSLYVPLFLTVWLWIPMLALILEL